MSSTSTPGEGRAGPPQRRWRRGIAAAALLLSGCPGPPPLPVVRVRVSPTPAAVGTARVLVDVLDAEGQAADGWEVTLRASPTDGASGAVIQASGRGGGRYVADPVELPTPGVWRLEVVARGPAGDSVSVARDLRVVGPASTR